MYESRGVSEEVSEGGVVDRAEHRVECLWAEAGDGGSEDDDDGGGVAGNGEVAGWGQSSTEHWKSPPESISLCFGVRCPRRGATVRSQRRTGVWRVHGLAHAGLDRWKGGNVTGIRGLGED